MDIGKDLKDQKDVVCPHTKTGSCDDCTLPAGEKCPYED